MSAVRGDWISLLAKPEKALSLPSVSDIAEEVWLDIKNNCNLNNVKLDVAYDWKVFQEPDYTSVLAYASRTMWLINDEWVSTALTGHDDLDGYIWIRVNPYVPNGWYVDDGTCNVGNHFDLKTVLRHEILHGVGISSSLRENNVGYNYNNICYPLQFDHEIETENGIKLIKGCNITSATSGDLYMNSVQLFNPDTYMPGSSYSHSTSGIMYAYIPARQCQYLDEEAVKMMEGLGATCSVSYASVGNQVSVSLLIILLCLFLTLKN